LVRKRCKPQAKSPATVESDVTSLLTSAPKKEVKPVVMKKSTEKQRIEEMAKSPKLSKPIARKEQKAKSQQSWHVFICRSTW